MKKVSFESLYSKLPTSKISVHSFTRVLLLGLLISMSSLIMAETDTGQANAENTQTNRSFKGYRAVVLKSDIPWNAWDSTMYGALKQRGMEVVWDEGTVIENPKLLAQFDLIATNIRRNFTPAQIEGLKAFLKSGGAIYITTTPCWGGDDLIDKGFLSLCGAASYSISKATNLTLLDGPLTESFGRTQVQLPTWSGHAWHPDGVKLMSFSITDGKSVAVNNEGKSLGIQKEHGAGRTVLLSVSPENYKFCFSDSQAQTADRMFDNTLHWLMPRGHKEHPWPNVIEVNLPRRAEVLSVFVNDKPLTKPMVRCIGSLRAVSIPVTAVKPGKTATVKIAYKPLSKARNVETWIHHPSGEFCNVFETPTEAVDFLSALHVTHIAPLLRSIGGGIFYRGIPGDIVSKRIKEYSGDYLAEYIAECHRRGIQFVGDFYTSANAVLEEYPEAEWIGKDGKPAKQPWVCLNNPKGQEHNLEAFRQLVDDYQLDGIMLDDNFQLIDRPCYCNYCKSHFKLYCQKKGIEYKDPSTLINDDAELQTAWEQYMTGSTRTFCAKMKAICDKRGIILSCWVNGALQSTVHNAELFDFLGGMIYEVPPYAASGPISYLGERGFLTLLWGMNRSPEAIETEVAEAIRSGSPAVGFWIQFLGKDNSKENWGLYSGKGGPQKHDKWFVEPGGLDAIARAFGHAEEIWFSWYKENLITGDCRFAVQSGVLGAKELKLTITNCGQRTTKRIHGKVDLAYLQQN